MLVLTLLMQSLTLSIALFWTMLHPHPVLYLCVPFRVCVDIVPDSVLVTPEVFKPPDLDLSDLTSFLLTDLVHQISSNLHVIFSFNFFCEHSIY